MLDENTNKMDNMKFIGINVKPHMQVYKNSQIHRVQSVAETWSRFILWKQQQNLHKINKTNIRHQQDRRVIPESRETSEPWDFPRLLPGKNYQAAVQEGGT